MRSQLINFISSTKKIISESGFRKFVGNSSDSLRNIASGRAGSSYADEACFFAGCFDEHDRQRLLVWMMINSVELIWSNYLDCAYAWDSCRGAFLSREIFRRWLLPLLIPRRASFSAAWSHFFRNCCSFEKFIFVLPGLHFEVCGCPSFASRGVKNAASANSVGSNKSSGKFL